MTALQGKSVVITGSGGGIGAASARLAAREGASVVVNDLDQAAVDAVVGQIERDGGRAVGVVANVADASDAERIVDTCVEAFGVIDGLVNNAGIMFVGPSDDLDAERTRRLIEVNVLGAIFCGVHAMRRMKAQGFGSIVNVTSGAHMGLSNTAVYGASKGRQPR
nr:SDR family oxidoreductase [Aeromicrobium chenweiae]